jgi:hypothetical protein
MAAHVSAIVPTQAAIAVFVTLLIDASLFVPVAQRAKSIRAAELERAHGGLVEF